MYALCMHIYIHISATASAISTRIRNCRSLLIINQRSFGAQTSLFHSKIASSVWRNSQLKSISDMKSGHHLYSGLNQLQNQGLSNMVKDGIPITWSAWEKNSSRPMILHSEICSWMILPYWCLKINLVYINVVNIGSWHWHWQYQWRYHWIAIIAITIHSSWMAINSYWRITTILRSYP